jgi:hypothetical protein
MMKKIVAQMLALSVLAMAFVQCGDDDKETPIEKEQLDKLSQTWNIVSADLDGTDRTGDFSGFSLTISGSFSSDSPEGPYDFSVSGSRPTPSPWPASGNWFFGADPESQIIRDEDDNGNVDGTDLGMNYIIASNGQLTITFDCPDGGCQFAGSRVKLVEGAWTFVFD